MTPICFKIKIIPFPFIFDGKYYTIFSNRNTNLNLSLFTDYELNTSNSLHETTSQRNLVGHENKMNPDNHPLIKDDKNSSIMIYSSIEEFENNLPPTVTVLTNEFGSRVYIVGTAHFSKESQDDVSFVIRNVCPDVVMVELCASRVHMLSHDEKTLLEEARDMSFSKIQSITKTNGLMNGLFYMLMLNMSAKLTNDLGMAPGGEFRRAVEEMKLLPNSVLHLGDRSINITLQRAFNGLSLWQTIKIIFKLIFSNKSITKEEVEQCKQKDLLEDLLEQMADEYPVFRNVFVTERDLYLCHSLSVAASPQFIDNNGKPKPVKVVGVVGIGHTAGIKKNWGKVSEEQLANIQVIPAASLSNRIFKFSLKYSLLILVGYGIFKITKPRMSNISIF